MSSAVLTSVIGQVTINLGFQIVATSYLAHQPWYVVHSLLCCSQILLTALSIKRFVPLTPSASTVVNCYENSVSFLFTIFQYIIVAVVFSVNDHHKKPFYTNGKMD